MTGMEVIMSVFFFLALKNPLMPICLWAVWKESFNLNTLFNGKGLAPPP